MDDNSAVALIQVEVDLAARHLEAVAAAVAESQRPSTRKAYTGAWKRFQAWAQREGVTSLPAAPVTVAAYLVHRDAVGLSLASLAMDRKAIRFFHRRAGLPTPTACEGVKMAIAGVRNRAAERGGLKRRQARGLREAELKAITDIAHIPRVYPTGRMESRGAARTRGAVDIAIVSVMRDALLRRQETAALRWADVEFQPDGSSWVTVSRSKTSNESRRPLCGRSGDGSPEPHPSGQSRSPTRECSAFGVAGPSVTGSPRCAGKRDSVRASPATRPGWE